MMPDPNTSREVGAGYKYVTLGIQFAGGIILFMLIGLWVDREFGSLPIGTVVGTLVGAFLSFLVVYRRLQQDAERERERRASQKEP